MEANYLLVPDAIALTRCDSKADVLAAVAARFGEAYGVEGDHVLESLQEREALGSTGFGRGVAIPHARIDGLKRPVVCVLRLDSPIDFEAADGMPVDLVFGLLSPTNSGVGHLHALAAISRLARDEATHEALTEAQSAEAIFALLSNVADRDAA